MSYRRHPKRTSSRRSVKKKALLRSSLFCATFALFTTTSHAINVEAPNDVPSSNDSPDAFGFDSSLLIGSPIGVADIERFNKPNTVEPGEYRIDIYVNKVFLASKAIEFRRTDNDDEVRPCLSDALLESGGVIVRSENAGAAGAQEQCAPLAARVPGASAKFNLSHLRLDLDVPLNQMKRTARGAVDPANLDAGRTMGYVNYDANYYTASTTRNLANSLYVGTQSGMNVGLWRFREQGTLSHYSGAGRNTTTWNNIRAYAERPLVSIGSKLEVGQSYTNSLLSPVAYTGVHIESDERMLPDSMLGYAPTAKGIARTNARVVVSQNGNVIYQTTVAPGPFVIDDLQPTGYYGDLVVRVYEADGQESSFKVPLLAAVTSLRPGMSRYGITLGRVRQIEGARAVFADLAYERGLTNTLTVNGALRVATGYQSALAGAVQGTSFGTFAANVIWSNAFDETGKRVHGWQTTLSHSHTLQPSNTTFAVTAYRYSSSGYRDLLDALGARAAYQDGRTWRSSTYRQRDRLTANINQGLGRYGSVLLSASASGYYKSSSRDTQYQLSYSNHFKSIDFALSVVRQRYLSHDGGSDPVIGSGSAFTPRRTYRGDTAVMATVSIPLGLGSRSPTLSSSVASSGNRDSTYQVSMNGSLGETRTLNYGVNVAGTTQGGQPTVSGALQHNFSAVQAGVSASQGSGFWQAGADLRGAAVVHAGGVTFGPYLSDTFGLVEAKGAEGATLRNANGVKVNSSGYAIVPSLTPYRNNDVALDSKGIHRKAELTTSEVRVAPYAGAAVLLKFSTRTGHAVLIRANTSDGSPLPLGANVVDANGTTIGIVGQGSQVYARVPDTQGTLIAEWGSQTKDRCTIDYRLDTTQTSSAIARLDGLCVSPPQSKLVAKK
ncbi:fimbria/pilus outer membrane usher protein [Paraburkholderia denitrificans]|uniref:Fimbria/pilus outer membrane usher protein n=1 Tax=Paraburkholderia denitrificans TaxID=694025 RepID=A0ABW0J929_9BURK